MVKICLARLNTEVAFFVVIKEEICSTIYKATRFTKRPADSTIYFVILFCDIIMVMEQRKGFTVLEIVIVAIFSSLLLVLFFLQKANVDAMNRDEKRKEAINAMYYALEEGFYAQNKFYPEKISDDNLKVMDISH